jgi:UDP:flavonoid glycosyltransferase YjiC (YdhE family)
MAQESPEHQPEDRAAVVVVAATVVQAELEQLAKEILEALATLKAVAVVAQAVQVEALAH